MIGTCDGNNRKKKQCSWWCVACGQHDWRAPNRILVVQLSASANEAKVFRAHAAPLGLCDNLVNALKLLANQQKGGDSPLESIVTGLHEESRKGIMDGLRNFIEVDNHSAVDVGGTRRGTKAIKVKKLQFSEAFPEAVISADELTMRAEEVGLLRTIIDRSREVGTAVGACGLARQDNSGKRCAITTKSCTRRQGPRSLVTVKRQRPFWTVKSGKGQRR